MASHHRFDHNDDDYQSSSSEDEKKLEKYRNRNEEESDSEVEVFGVGSDGDSDSGDDQSEIALSDVEGQDQDDDLPDVRAWGKEKKKYYGADYVDPDYGGFQGKDAHAAEIEEEEAKILQNQLMQQLDDNDFSLDVIFKKPEKEAKEQTEVVIKTDLSKLTAKEKLQLLQKESPEFFGLIDDFKVKISLAKDYLQPILQKVKEGTIDHCRAVELVQTHYHLILNYALNINMYLLLKGNNKLKNHPIIQRLYQYRQLLAQIEPVFEEVIKPQIELLLAEKHVEKGIGRTPGLVNSKKKKVLNLLSQLQKTEKIKTQKTEWNTGPPNKRIKLDAEKKQKHVNFVSDEGGEVAEEELNDNMEPENGDPTFVAEDPEESGKRAITYQIAKNKGLTPHRKKELRNPRVKHKLKFRKALIRRKGAVREPRKELSRYSGEISGIKASVSKSIKIKS